MNDDILNYVEERKRVARNIASRNADKALTRKDFREIVDISEPTVTRYLKALKIKIKPDGAAQSRYTIPLQIGDKIIEYKILGRKL